MLVANLNVRLHAAHIHSSPAAGKAKHRHLRTPCGAVESGRRTPEAGRRWQRGGPPAQADTHTHTHTHTHTSESRVAEWDEVGCCGWFAVGRQHLGVGTRIRCGIRAVGVHIRPTARQQQRVRSHAAQGHDNANERDRDRRRERRRERGEKREKTRERRRERGEREREKPLMKSGCQGPPRDYSSGCCCSGGKRSAVSKNVAPEFHFPEETTVDEGEERERERG